MLDRIRRDVDTWLILAVPLLLLAAALPQLGLFRGLAGVLAGAAVTVAAGQYFYRQAAYDLQQEADWRRRETDTLVSALEEAGVIEPVSRDSKGRLVGKVRLRLAPAKATASAPDVFVEVGDPPSGKEDKPSSESKPADE